MRKAKVYRIAEKDYVQGRDIDLSKEALFNSKGQRITEELQLNLIVRFLFSDFLDRKLLAVSMLTTFYKMTRHTMSLKTTK